MLAKNAELVDLIGAEEAGTLPGLFLARLARSGSRVAYREFDPALGTWRTFTWQQVASRIVRFQEALAKEGVRPGDRVAIALPNCVDWIAFDIAAMGLGLVVVPLYAHDSVANISMILAHSETRLLFADTWSRWRALRSHCTKLPNLDSVWLRDANQTEAAAEGDGPARELAAVLAGASTDHDFVNLAQPRSLAALVYTSGTTGRPKGAKLTHYALLWNAEAGTRRIAPRTDDVFLSFLPLAHAFERTAGYTMAVMGGSTVAFARSIDRLRADFRQVRPTAFIAVPRVFELIGAAIKTRVSKTAFRRRLFDRTVALGWQRFEAAQGRGPRLGLLDKIAWHLLQLLVARPVLNALGGRLRVTVSGGAAVRRDLLRQLIGLGLPIVEGYGLTEAAPVVSANSLTDNLPGSVGRPLEGVEVAISDRGELLVRTPSVMTGYWGDDSGTAQAIDNEGWLHTGDLAEFREGHIFIRGRLKDVIVLATGEKINPDDIEDELVREPLFRQALVVGEGKPFLVAVLVLEPERWQAHARQHGLRPDDPNDGAAAREIIRLARHQLADRPRPLQVHFVHATLTPWTIEAGLLTPTLKIKRKPVERLFEKEISALYARFAIAG
jgi:long-chain acyl-CoA synthetase